MRANQTRGIIGGTAILLALTTSCSSTSTTSSVPPSQDTNSPSTSASGSPASPAPASGTKSPQTAASPQVSPAATEFNPPGDIPDNQIYVDYKAAGSAVHIKVPEGWSRSSSGGTTTFTDHYNSIAIEVVPSAKPPSVTTAERTDVPRLRKTVAAFAHGTISSIQRQHGTAVLMTYYLDSAPSPVTGKVVRDVAERYEFWQHGQEAILTLTGPKGADNVDPWRLVSDSLRWG